MIPTLILRQEAERELADAYRWYEARVPGLGAQFLGVVERTLHSMQDNPLRFPVIHRDIRRALPRRFPYEIFFVWEMDTITVLSIMHGARDPSRWKAKGYRP